MENTKPFLSERQDFKVRSSHFTALIGHEFYTQEYLPAEFELLAKSTTYLYWFNFQRKNLKTKKTPFELVKQQTFLIHHFFKPSIYLLDNLPWLATTALRSVPYVTDEVRRGGCSADSGLVADLLKQCLKI
jgi:hypothetical protein